MIKNKTKKVEYSKSEQTWTITIWLTKQLNWLRKISMIRMFQIRNRVMMKSKLIRQVRSHRRLSRQRLLHLLLTRRITPFLRYSGNGRALQIGKRELQHILKNKKTFTTPSFQRFKSWKESWPARTPGTCLSTARKMTYSFKRRSQSEASSSSEPKVILSVMQRIFSGASCTIPWRANGISTVTKPFIARRLA